MTGFRILFLAVLLTTATVPAWAGDDVDAVTAASIDAETGASTVLEPVSVVGDFAVPYATNDDGSFFIQARDLADAYHRNETASDSLFKGNAVVVKGTVERTSKPGAKRPWIVLAGDGNSGKTVRCALRPGEMTEPPPEPDSVVQIRGICDGMKLSVSLSDGEFLK
ncbi:MAG: OB-fold putative lipoprotein [Planctomycetes bacterium]|nr:OB-fold putative lipoprotein [Planctomycetota bacterium]